MTYYPDEVPHHLTYPNTPIHSLLEEAAQRYPNAAATSFFGSTITYSELNRDANRFAHALKAAGLDAGDRVAIHLPNCPQLLISLYGTLKAGGVATMVSPLYEKREIVYQLQDSGAAIMVTLSQEDIFNKAVAAQQEAHLRQLVVTSIRDCFPLHLRSLFTIFKEKKGGHRATLNPSLGQVWFNRFTRGKPGTKPGTPVDPHATAVLQYTGGTTGIPKAAELSHNNLIANVYQTRAWLHGLKEAEESTLLVLPLFHVYALTCLNLSVHMAAKTILLPRFDLHEVLKAIEQEKPTLFPGIPAMYAAINHSLDRARDKGGKTPDLSSIRICISGSDKLPSEVQNRFEELTGGRLVEGYGLTEASPVTHVNPVHGLRKVGSIGLPLPDTETRIVDLESGKDTAPGNEGEMLVRGPQVMKGYWNIPEETAEALTGDGWLKTGDVARVDDDGFYYIVDRKKDMIITGGHNVYPREIEEVLSQLKKVSEVAVKGLPHRLRGEIIKAYVVLKENEKATADEIRRYAREKLADYKVPHKVEFRSELPRSILRKVLKRKLDENEDQEESGENINKNHI